LDGDGSDLFGNYVCMGCCLDRSELEGQEGTDVEGVPCSLYPSGSLYCRG